MNKGKQSGKGCIEKMLNREDRKKITIFCDEGMIFSQQLMDEASDVENNYSDYERAQRLFRAFYELKMEYIGRKY